MRKTKAVRQGVILAAGRGSRALPLSMKYPKPLLPVLNRPILEYQIEALKNAGINEVIIVIGFLGDKIKKYFGNGQKYGVDISYVYDNNPQGIASSLFSVKDKTQGPFVLFLGDIFMDNIDLLPSIKKFNEYEANGVVIGRVDSLEKIKGNFAIVYDKRDLIKKVVEKPQKPSGRVKGYGYYIFDQGIFEAIGKTGKSNLRDEIEITDSIQTFIDLGARVVCDLWDKWDVNVTDPGDLLECNLRMLRLKNLKNLIDDTVIIGNNVEIASSIVGKQAKIGDKVTLSECLVLPNVEVISEGNFASRYIFGEGVTVSV